MTFFMTSSGLLVIIDIPCQVLQIQERRYYKNCCKVCINRKDMKYGMENNGWRTVVINNRAKLNLYDGNIKVTKEGKSETIPISQLKVLMINSLEVTITSHLINELNSNNVKIIFCDEKYLPSCEICGYSNNVNSAGRQQDQILWSEEIKSFVWTKIVKRKIISQYNVLRKNNIPNADIFLDIVSKVTEKNAIMQEALAAKLYFVMLFGEDFNRRTESLINSALNYGYSILMSSISRDIVLHGYLTGIGINHHNQKNPWNFSCDIIEPFRAYIDDYVYKNPPEELNWDYKKKLIDLSVSTVVYNKRKMELQTAVDMFVNDVIVELSGKTNRMGVLEFYGET